MKKICALAGSNSSTSINYQLVKYAADLMAGVEVEVLDIRHWQIPIYSVDMDEKKITPDIISDLIKALAEFDGFVISVPEHNGGPTVFFKNITDWLTRRSDKILDGRPVLLMSTSPGRGGAEHSREYYERNMHRIGGEIVSTFSLPSFHHTIIDRRMIDEHLILLHEAISTFLKALA